MFISPGGGVEAWDCDAGIGIPCIRSAAAGGADFFAGGAVICMPGMSIFCARAAELAKATAIEVETRTWTNLTRIALFDGAPSADAEGAFVAA